MAPPPPHIIIIPAACQTSAFYTPLTDALSALGLSASTIVPLPSVGVNPGVPDFSADVDAIRKTVQSVLDKGTDVVVLMHSYGGLPGSAALKGLGKVAGDKGEKAGVVRVIYVCSFVLGEGGKMPGAGDAEGLKKMMGEGFDEVVSIILYYFYPPFKAVKWVECGGSIGLFCCYLFSVKWETNSPFQEVAFC